MQLIGRTDRIDLPELHLMDLDAKIDTGAYGNALHCHHIEIDGKGEDAVLVFDLLDPDHPEYEKEIFRFTEFGHKVVRNTGGEAEHRYTIMTELIIFNESYNLEFSLTNRALMKTPVLLGRKFLNQRFLVDVNEKNLSYKLKTKKI